jgi:hypothetical protein
MALSEKLIVFFDSRAYSSYLIPDTIALLSSAAILTLN